MYMFEELIVKFICLSIFIQLCTLLLLLVLVLLLLCLDIACVGSALAGHQLLRCHGVAASHITPTGKTWYLGILCNINRDNLPLVY
jgi:hypothetical protein